MSDDDRRRFQEAADRMIMRFAHAIVGEELEHAVGALAAFVRSFCDRYGISLDEFYRLAREDPPELN